MSRSSHPLRKILFLVGISLALLLLVTEALALEVDPGKAALGKNLYRSYCSSCHGAAGQGDGTVAEYLTVPPSDLTVLAKNNDGQFPAERTRKVIDGREKVKGHGSGEMPAWGDAFKAVSDNEEAVTEKIDKLVHFLMSIQQE